MEDLAPVNLAPRNELRELRETFEHKSRWESSSLAEVVRELYMDVAGRNAQERREHAHAAHLMSSLRSGKQMMKRDPVYGNLALIKPLPRRTQNDAHVYPLAQVNSTQLTSVWTLARPKTVPRHFGNTNKAQIQHAMITKIIEHYDQEWMDELFHQRESLMAMDFGTMAIRVEYDDKLNRLTQLMPVLANKAETVFPGYGNCKVCGYEGTPDEFGAIDSHPQCPHCGNYDVGDLVPAQEVEVPTIVGADVVSQGDIRIDLIPIPSLNWDMRKLVQESSWVHQRTVTSRRLIESIMGVHIAEHDGDDDYAMSLWNQIGTRGGSLPGFGRENLSGNYDPIPGQTVMDEMWFKPEHYAGTTIPKAEKTVGGITIPAKTPFEQIFPKGMCVVGFNEMRVIAGIYHEPCRITSSVYHIQSNSGIGKGTQDSVEISEHLSVAHSAAMAVIQRFGAGGGHWYDSDVMSAREAAALLKPGGLVGIKMRGTNYTSVDQVLRKIETGSLDQGNMAMIAQLANMLNIVFQTTDFTSGVADNRVDINTLGGQQLLQAQNQQRSAAPLRMKSYLRARVFENVIELFRENIRMPKFFGTNDKFGLSRGRYISGAELPEYVKCDSIPDSELPTNALTKRDNFERLLEKTGQAGTPFLQVAAESPRTAAWMAEQFQVELPLFNYGEILVVCQDRIDQIAEASRMMEQVAELSGFADDPEIVAEQIIDQITPPIESTEDNHDIKAQVLSEYLDDDEVKQWTVYQRAAVQALIWRHHKAARDFRTALQGLEQEGQLGLQQIAMEAQMAAQQPMMEQQAAMQQQQQAAAVEGEALSRVAEQAEAGMEFSRQQEAADADLERQKELEKLKQRQVRNQPGTKGK